MARITFGGGHHLDAEHLDAQSCVAQLAQSREQRLTTFTNRPLPLGWMSVTAGGRETYVQASQVASVDDADRDAMPEVESTDRPRGDLA
jgi:hypothetical protein